MCISILSKKAEKVSRRQRDCDEAGRERDEVKVEAKKDVLNTYCNYEHLFFQWSDLIFNSRFFPRILRYDTRCYFDVRSKADISQLNLPHGTDNEKSVKTEKVKRRICSEVTVNSLGNPYSET